MSHIILIHGAWAGRWVWDNLLPGLDTAGHVAHAVDLPGNGQDGRAPEDITLATYVSHVQELLETLPGKVFLVSHSGGGVTATQVAEAMPEKVAGVVYIAGMMLPSGVPFGEITGALREQHPDISGIVPHLRWNSARSASTVPAEAAQNIFLHDVPAPQAQAAAARLTAQPEAARAAPPVWTPERYGSLPRLYVEATRDRSVLIAAQRRMQSLTPGAHVVTLDCGHVPQVAAPDALLDALLSFFSATVE